LEEEKNEKENRRNFCKYVLNNVFLRGGIKTWKGREVGGIYDSSYCPLCFYRSATTPLKTIVRKK